MNQGLPQARSRSVWGRKASSDGRSNHWMHPFESRTRAAFDLNVVMGTSSEHEGQLAKCQVLRKSIPLKPETLEINGTTWRIKRAVSTNAAF